MSKKLQASRNRRLNKKSGSTCLVAGKAKGERTRSSAKATSKKLVSLVINSRKNRFLLLSLSPPFLCLAIPIHCLKSHAAFQPNEFGISSPNAKIIIIITIVFLYTLHRLDQRMMVRSMYGVINPSIWNLPTISYPRDR